ncbi:hypothetical protein [Falsiroseomonas sp.]|uniref:hypothetical protein n=1 Tax=Falsiroseomonas sp. TaxID=2870721 RepID=UPI0034A1C1C1
MPNRETRRLTSAWPYFADANVEVLSMAGQQPALADAVASIVGIAAQRARSNGTFDTLREAVEAALQGVPQPVDRTSRPCTIGRSGGQAPARRG